MADIVYIEQGYYQGDNYFTYTADASATLNTNATVACTVTNVKTLACDFSALFTPSLTATILKNHTAVLDVNASMQSTISKIASNQSTLDNIVTLSLQGDRGRTVDSTLSASFTQSAQIQKILNANSTLNTEFTQSTQIQKTLSANSTLNAEFTVTAEGTLTGAATEASAALTVEFSVNAIISKTVTVTANISTEATQTTQADRFRGIEKTLIGEVTIFTEIGKLQLAACDFSTLFTPNVICVVTKNHTAILDAVSSLNCAITKFTNFSANANSEFTITATASRLRADTASISAEFTHSTQADRFRGISHTFNTEVIIFTEIGLLQSGACDFSTLFSPTVTCVALRNHTAVLDAVSSLSCVIEKTVGFTSTLNTEFGLSVNIIRFRSMSATVNSVFNQTAVVGKIVQGVNTFLSTFIITNQNPSVSPNFFVGTLETAQASISSQFSLSITFITWKSKWYGSPRPLTWNKSAAATLRSNDIILAKNGQEIAVNSGINDWFTIGNQDFTVETYISIQNPYLISGSAQQTYVPFIWFLKPGLGFNYNLPQIEDISNQTIFQASNLIGYFNKTEITDLIIAFNDPTYGFQPIGTITLPETGGFYNFYMAFGRQNGVFKFRHDNTLTSTTMPNYITTNIPATRTISLINNYRATDISVVNFYINYFHFKIGEWLPSGSTSNDLATPATDPSNVIYNNEYTRTYAKFNNNLNDTLIGVLTAQTSITATATMTTVAGKSTTAQATLSTQFTVSALIGEIEPADIQMNTVCSLSVMATRIQPGTSNLNASASQSVDISKITGFNISLNSAVTVSNTITRIKQLFTEFSAIATELATVVKIGQGLITMDSVAQLTTVANRTAAAESNQLTQFGITAQGDRTRFGTVSTQSEFSLNALNSRIRALNSSQNTEFALTATTDRIRSTVSTFSSEFTVSCEPLPIKSAQSNQSAQFTQITTVDRIRDTSVTFNANFTQQSTGIIAVDAVADLNSEAQSSITVLRIRPGQVQMDAIAVNLTAAAKTGAGLVTIESQSQCTVSAQKITDIQLTAVSTAELTSIIERIQQGVANIQSTFTQTANGILSTDVVTNMNTLFSTTVTAQKTVSVISTIASEGGFVMAAVAIRNNEILMPAQSTITVLNGRTRFVSTNLQNSITLNILAGKVAVAQCVMNTTVTQNCTAGVLRLDDIILYIKTESRTHSINNEQRSYAIREENRLYTIEE